VSGKISAAEAELLPSCAVRFQPCYDHVQFSTPTLKRDKLHGCKERISGALGIQGSLTAERKLVWFGQPSKTIPDEDTILLFKYVSRLNVREKGYLSLFQSRWKRGTKWE